MVFRHPFPGPGSACASSAKSKREYADLLRRADAIFIEELRAADWYDKVAQAFAFPAGALGRRDGRRPHLRERRRAARGADQRLHDRDWAPLPHELLSRVSSRIINEVRGINRVTYDISSKPPATIEWSRRSVGKMLVDGW
jgi:GMP synthase (glutamine-hydrolysing)